MRHFILQKPKIRITTDFSLETIQAREDWSKALKALWVDTKYFKSEDKIKTFPSLKVKRIHHSRHEL